MNNNSQETISDQESVLTDEIQKLKSNTGGRRNFFAALFIVALIGAAVILIVYRHEKWQSAQIHVLTEQVRELQSQVISNQKNIEYAETDFNYLAIGNSITVHGIADYWWNEIGMAATTEDKDYVHIVADYLNQTYGAVCFYAVNFFSWESQAHDRAETYEIIEPYLSKELDLVTIQLGENASDLTTFESDYFSLMTYIQQKAPDARIIIIDDFWDNAEKESIKRKVAGSLGIPFVVLDEIKGDPQYQCGIGTTVYDEHGDPHVVEHTGVAGHPGDAGMKYIADKIIDNLKN